MLSAQSHVIVGCLFVATGILAAALQFWLWTFPMEPDPGGLDPNGKTSAPFFWRMFHRGLGYLFSLLLLTILASMAPRLFTFSGDVWNATAVSHALVALLLLPVLCFKVWILRRGQRLGKWLPKLGGTLAALAIVVVATGTWPVLRLRQLPLPAGWSVADRKATVSHIERNCTSCHGLSVVAGHLDEPDEWPEVLEEMTEKSQRLGRPDPAGAMASSLATYLSAGAQSTESGRKRRGRSDDDD